MGKDWKEIVDVDVSLWATFQSNMAKHLSNKQDTSLLERAQDALRLLFEKLEKGNYDRVMFSEHKDDAVVGGFSDIRTIDQFADYSKNPPYFIKKMTIEAARQAYEDSKLAGQLGRDVFYLAPVVFPPLEYDTFALLVTQITPGPDVGKIFRALNTKISEDDTTAKKLKTMILEKNLDDLVTWQGSFEQSMLSEVLSANKRPQVVINRYTSATQNAIDNATKIAYASPDLSFSVSDPERELVELGLRLYSMLKLDGGRLVRIRDDTETNSGLELGKMRYKDEQELFDSLLGFVAKANGNNGKEVSRDSINRLYVHWDTATGSFGHFLEDFYRMIDSFSLSITEFEKVTMYRQFLGKRFGTDAEQHDIELDNSLIRFFRNFRHRDVVISEFAFNNEESYRKGIKDAAARDLKRGDYTEKARHYMGMATQPLDDVIENSLQNLGTRTQTEKERIRGNFQSALAINSLVRSSPIAYQGFQNQVDPYVKEVIKVIKETDSDDVRELGQLIALSYITKKMANYDNLHFDRMLKS